MTYRVGGNFINGPRVYKLEHIVSSSLTDRLKLEFTHCHCGIRHKHIMEHLGARSQHEFMASENVCWIEPKHEISAIIPEMPPIRSVNFSDFSRSLLSFNLLDWMMSLGGLHSRVSSLS